MKNGKWKTKNGFDFEILVITSIYKAFSLTYTNQKEIYHYPFSLLHYKIFRITLILWHI